MDVLKKLLHGDGSPPPKTQDELKKLCAHSFLCRDRLCVEDDHKHCVPREEAKRALSVTLLPPELERKVRWHGSIPDFNSRLDHLNERIKEAIKTGHPTYETVEQIRRDFNSIQHDVDYLSPRMKIATWLEPITTEHQTLLLNGFIPLVRMLSDPDFRKIHSHKLYYQRMGWRGTVGGTDPDRKQRLGLPSD